MDISRRDLLKVGLAAAGGASGCRGAGERDDAGGAVPDAAAGGTDGGIASAEARLATDSAPDDARIEAHSPVEAAPPSLTPDQLLAPLDTFVVLCMENRSFDHY